MKRILLAALLAVSMTGAAYADEENLQACYATADLMKSLAQGRDDGVSRGRAIQMAENASKKEHVVRLMKFAIDAVYVGGMRDTPPRRVYRLMVDKCQAMF